MGMAVHEDPTALEPGVVSAEPVLPNTPLTTPRDQTSAANQKQPSPGDAILDPETQGTRVKQEPMSPGATGVGLIPKIEGTSQHPQPPGGSDGLVAPLTNEKAQNNSGNASYVLSRKKTPSAAVTWNSPPPDAGP